MNNANPTPKEIADEIARIILRDTGARIEVTFRTGEDFTVSGRPADVAKAKPYFPGFVLTGEEHDAELGETFAYFSLRK